MVLESSKTSSKLVEKPNEDMCSLWDEVRTCKF
jgi:hypothetical protein